MILFFILLCVLLFAFGVFICVEFLNTMLEAFDGHMVGSEDYRYFPDKM